MTNPSRDTVAARYRRMVKFNATVSFDRWLERYRGRLELFELAEIAMSRFHDGQIQPRRNLSGYEPAHQRRLKRK